MKNPSQKSKQSGFTLIELSIVLVIIGLIVGGVLVGQDLIRAAEIRAMQSKVQEYDAAVNTFRIKYGGIPGDLKNAYLFFGADIGCTNAQVSWNPSGGRSACNGNGDKYITDGYGSEMIRAFQQLEISGLISEGILPVGNLNDVDTAITSSTEPRGYFPIGARKSIWGLQCWRNGGTSSCRHSGGNHKVSPTHYYTIASSKDSVGGSLWAGGHTYNGGLITPIEAHDWDTKFDDGLALSGRIRGNTGTNHIVNGSCGPTWGEYSLNNSDLSNRKKCYLRVEAGF